ncbi:MAG: macro domain-containing protein [Candidatus Dechloromonas phosphoritropha]
MTRSDFLITVVQGNIVRQVDCDAIVNSANQNLRAGSGVCGAIYQAAGPALEPCTIQLAPLGLGAAVATPGFDLPNRLIIHTRGPKYFFDPDPPRNLAAALRNTLLVADENRVQRIAVPAISMGIFSYPPEEAVPILVQTARQVGKLLNWVQEVRFVVLEDSLFQRFSNEIRETG